MALVKTYFRKRIKTQSDFIQLSWGGLFYWLIFIFIVFRVAWAGANPNSLLLRVCGQHRLISLSNIQGYWMLPVTPCGACKLSDSTTLIGYISVGMRIFTSETGQAIGCVVADVKRSPEASKRPGSTEEVWRNEPSGSYIYIYKNLHYIWHFMVHFKHTRT